MGAGVASPSALVAYGACLVAIALAPSLILFVIAALLFGAAKGGVDVGINAQAVVVEQCYGRTIMSSFQALWSVGGLAGGFLTSAALGLGSIPATNLMFVGLLLLLLDLVCYSHLIARRIVPGGGEWEALSSPWQSIALRGHPHFHRLVQ